MIKVEHESTFKYMNDNLIPFHRKKHYLGYCTMNIKENRAFEWQKTLMKLLAVNEMSYAKCL